MKRRFLIGRFIDKRTSQAGRTFGAAFLTNRRAEELRRLGFKVFSA